MGGLHVALGVAHIDAFAGGDPGEPRGVQQGQRDAACVRASVSPLTTQAKRARRPSSLEQRFGEPRRLVGDDAGSSCARRASAASTSSMPGKSRVSRLRRAAIDLQEAPLQARRTAAGSASGKSDLHDARGAVAHRGAHRIVGQRRENRARGAAHSAQPTMSGAVSSKVPSRSNNTARSGRPCQSGPGLEKCAR